jgi:hypothetical protein
MTQKHFTSFVMLIILFPVFQLNAFDYGLVLDQTLMYETASQSEGFSKEGFSYGGIITPWFSTPLGDKRKLFISAGVNAEYVNEKWTIIPELLLTEFTWRFEGGKEIKAGRTVYTDPLGFIATGLFDGVMYTQDLWGGTLSAGAWYTGLLYKRSAHITMTDEDLNLYNDDLSYRNFAKSYFAPRRLLFAFDWEHPGLAEIIRLNAALICQFDLSGGEKLYHSQYLTGKASVPLNDFVFELGFCMEIAEASRHFNCSFAGELGVGWSLPTPIDDKLFLLARLSAGMANDVLTAFIPVTTDTQGYILKAKLSGLSMIQAGYMARLHQSLSVNIFNSYFILSDKGTYQGLPAGRDGFFLGNELYGMAIFSPFSDLQIKLGGGVFLPSFGNADKKASPLWQIDLNVTVAFF